MSEVLVDGTESFTEVASVAAEALLDELSELSERVFVGLSVSTAGARAGVVLVKFWHGFSFPFPKMKQLWT
jgi:hypothetical protein